MPEELAFVATVALLLDEVEIDLLRVVHGLGLGLGYSIIKKNFMYMKCQNRVYRWQQWQLMIRKAMFSNAFRIFGFKNGPLFPIGNPYRLPFPKIDRICSSRQFMSSKQNEKSSILPLLYVKVAVPNFYNILNFTALRLIKIKNKQQYQSFNFHVRAAASVLDGPLDLFSLLLELVEIPHWAVFSLRAGGRLVVVDLWETAEAKPQAHEFFEFSQFEGEDGFDEIKQLVDHKIHDRDVAVVPSSFGTVVLVVEQYRLDFTAPIEGQVLLFFRGEGGPSLADEAEDGVSDVVLAADAINFDLVCDIPAEEIASIGPLDDIVDHCRGTCDNEGAVLAEGELLYDPVLGLSLLVLVPLVGREELINVRHVQVFAEEAADLHLSPERVVSEGERLRLFFFLSPVGTH